jgi:hypothetical protein
MALMGMAVPYRPREFGFGQWARRMQETQRPFHSDFVLNSST